MPRTLSSPTSTAAALTFTQPGFLVQLSFSTVQRFSSRGDVSWNAFTWANNNVDVGQLQEQANGNTSLVIKVGNADKAFGAVCLGEAPQEKAVSVWAFYGTATAAGDPVQIFGGVIDTCQIDEQFVTLQLQASNASTMFIPRRRITKGTGFNRLSPAGRVIEFGGVRYEIGKA